jgi:hypothetical protein
VGLTRFVAAPAALAGAFAFRARVGFGFGAGFALCFTVAFGGV